MYPNHTCFRFHAVILTGGPKIAVTVEEEGKTQEETVATTGGEGIGVEEASETELMEAEAVRIGSR